MFTALCVESLSLGPDRSFPVFPILDLSLNRGHRVSEFGYLTFTRDYLLTQLLLLLAEGSLVVVNRLFLLFTLKVFDLLCHPSDVLLATLLVAHLTSSLRFKFLDVLFLRGDGLDFLVCLLFDHVHHLPASLDNLIDLVMIRLRSFSGFSDGLDFLI